MRFPSGLPVLYEIPLCSLKFSNVNSIAAAIDEHHWLEILSMFLKVKMIHKYTIE